MGRFLVSTGTRNHRRTTCDKCSKAVRESWRECLEKVHEQLQRRTAPTIAEMLNVLAAMPLASDDYATARSRTESLKRYADACEWGAAQFELRLLKVLA
jgi:hypothetical protein